MDTSFKEEINLQRLSSVMDTSFNKEINLQRLSSVAIAIHIWELPDIAQQLEEFFKGNSTVTKWLEIRKSVSNKLYSARLPLTLKRRLEDTLEEIGEKIFDWRCNFIHTPNKKLYWHSDGVINEDRSVPEIWTQADADRIFLKSYCVFNTSNTLYEFLRVLPRLCILACIHAREEWILDHQTQFIETFNKHYPRLEFDMTDVAFSAMTVVLRGLYCNKTSGNYERFISQNGRVMLCAKRMLYVSVYLHLYKPVVYFWNKMDLIEQENYLRKLSEKKLDCAMIDHRISSSETRNLLDIFTFFASKMSEIQKNQFILNNFPLVFAVLSKRWSSQKFCISLLNQFWGFLNENDLRKMLTDTVLVLPVTIDNNVKFDMEEYFLLPILAILLNKSSKSTKQAVFGFIDSTIWLATADDYTEGSELLRKLAHFKPYMFELIYSDPDLRKFTHIMTDITKDATLLHNLNISDQLFEKSYLLKNPEYQIYSKILNLWIVNDDFDLVDRFLNFLPGGSSVKSQINFVGISYRLSQTNKDSHKLMNWYFDDQGCEEDEDIINSCKDKMLTSKKFCRDVIYGIWFQRDPDFLNCIEESDKFLHWFFQDDQEISVFKRNELVTIDSVQLFCHSLGEHPQVNFNIIDEFFEFCLLPPGKIEEIKRDIQENITDWIDRYCLNEGFFTIVNNLLDWVFENAAEKEKVLEKYLKDSDKAASICVKKRL